MVKSIGGYSYMGCSQIAMGRCMAKFQVHEVCEMSKLSEAPAVSEKLSRCTVPNGRITFWYSYRRGWQRHLLPESGAAFGSGTEHLGREADDLVNGRGTNWYVACVCGMAWLWLGFGFGWSILVHTLKSSCFSFPWLKPRRLLVERNLVLSWDSVKDIWIGPSLQHLPKSPSLQHLPNPSPVHIEHRVE